MAAGHEVDDECLQCALTAVNNLAMNEKNQPLLEVCLVAFQLFFYVSSARNDHNEAMMANSCVFLLSRITEQDV